ncbi:hypothetical protein ACFFLM_03640 [Deinococcus oregonensis]|uniref:RDD domain-containing protein n=1 Tax=Deinococcus oregonensis TaxID=1805970 RepID=A0ABV6AWT6_9DEIO
MTTEDVPPHGVQLRPLFPSAALAVTTFQLLRRIDRQFRAVSAGHEIFDFQNDLTVPAMTRQLQDYSVQSQRLYRQFFIVDAVFPLAASIFLYGLHGALLRAAPSRISGALLRWHAPLLTLLPTLFDWGENILFLRVIERWPEPSPAGMRAGITFKRLKLISLKGVAGLTGLYIMSWLAVMGTRRSGHFQTLVRRSAPRRSPHSGSSLDEILVEKVDPRKTNPCLARKVPPFLKGRQSVPRDHRDAGVPRHS